jgi:hypothetical protein
MELDFTTKTQRTQSFWGMGPDIQLPRIFSDISVNSVSLW